MFEKIVELANFTNIWDIVAKSYTGDKGQESEGTGLEEIIWDNEDEELREFRWLLHKVGDSHQPNKERWRFHNK